MSALANPALWASIGAFLAVIGVQGIPAALWNHIVEAIAAVAALIGFIIAARTPKEPKEPPNA